MTSHTAPPKCLIEPSRPPTNTSSGAKPYTAYSAPLVPESCGSHSDPFQRNTVPLSPTANASVLEYAQTPFKAGW